jgi:uncharacterized protein YegP (UPF0339 family)
MTDSEALFAQCYRDGSGEWRWRIKARNGNVLADSGESYQQRHHMLKALFAVHPGIDVEYLDGEA